MFVHSVHPALSCSIILAIKLALQGMNQTLKEFNASKRLLGMELEE